MNVLLLILGLVLVIAGADCLVNGRIAGQQVAALEPVA